MRGPAEGRARCCKLPRPAARQILPGWKIAHSLHATRRFGARSRRPVFPKIGGSVIARRTLALCCSIALVSPAGWAKARVVAASYYRAQERQHLAAAIKEAKLPAGTAVYFGTYGIDKDDAAAA